MIEQVRSQCHPKNTSDTETAMHLKNKYIITKGYLFTLPIHTEIEQWHLYKLRDLSINLMHISESTNIDSN